VVVIEQNGRTVATRTVAQDHAFAVALPVSTYTVTARVAGTSCEKDVAHLTADHQALVEIACSSDSGIG
jgi:hypothetical protein